MRVLDESVRQGRTHRMNLLTDHTKLLNQDSKPERRLEAPPRSSDLVNGAAAVFNRLGGLMAGLAEQHAVDIPCQLAIWVAQSGGRVSIRSSRSMIRFEVQRFFNLWGRQNRQDFDGHFKFGGHSLQPGQPWENQEYRGEEGSFAGVHHNQNSEYSALTIARMLCGDDLALASSSLGGPLLPVADHLSMGFDRPSAMFEAFREGEGIQLSALLNHLISHSAPKVGDLLRYLRKKDWDSFANYFTGADQIPMDVARLQAAYSAAVGLLM
jgi:hypothetical protein